MRTRNACTWQFWLANGIIVAVLVLTQAQHSDPQNSQCELYGNYILSALVNFDIAGMRAAPSRN
eukprot:15379217-Alexandrium_andersonii.AAC.1